MKPIVGIFICALLGLPSLGAQEGLWRWGLDAPWPAGGRVDGLSQDAAGAWVLAPGAAAPPGGDPFGPPAGTALPGPDQVLAFEAGPGDSGGRYRSEGGSVTGRLVRHGRGAGVFGTGQAPLQLFPGTDALFSPGRLWGDFSWEFWLYPSVLGEGEELLSWRGVLRRGPATLEQSVQIRVSDRRLVWDFRNFFAEPVTQPVRVTGGRSLLPRTWSHHKLRFSSRTGLLEYLVDGLPEAVFYVTDTQREGGTVRRPRLGGVDSAPLLIGRSYQGLVDAWSLTEAWTGDQPARRYREEPGFWESPLLDLGAPQSSLLGLDLRAQVPGATGLRLRYRLAEERRYQWTWSGTTEVRLDEPWQDWDPAQALESRPRGRWLQLRAEFLPEGTGELSPRLEALTVRWRRNQPPAIPAGLYAESGPGQVTLRWRPVTQAHHRGYKIYFGPAPGRYEGARRLASPLDVGNVTEVTLQDLEPDRLYYFTVVSYDASPEPLESAFAPEVQARPGRRP